ncbi:hypothetical protein TIFTF001_053444 [Ficus carica]|uniref:Uncharacterized protein n=1 Tax=Ficus carica TaxID=3494 RepID=A0AA88EEU1_FICCA|nr:hypothetical protein TIFTF001_053444 [Ficus carica]
MHDDMFCVADVIVVLAERKLTSYVYAVDYYNDMYLMLNPGWIKEDPEAPWHSEERRRSYASSIRLKECRRLDEEARTWCLGMEDLRGDDTSVVLKSGTLIRMILWNSTANGSELRSESVVDKLSLRYDMI